MKKAVIIYGPPGGGKGTQSELLVKKLGLINFDTGSYIESVVHDPKNKNNKEVQREREFFDNGSLNTPSWVLKVVKENVARIAESGFGVVLSGSPRTMYEAFGKGEGQPEGEKPTEGLLSLLEKKYSRDNIFIFELVLPENNSVTRNAGRLLCSLCRLSVFGKEYQNAKTCPFCGSPLFKRTLDKPEIIKKRLQQYRDRTQPILKELRKRKIKIIKIDATATPAKVFENISKHLRK